MHHFSLFENLPASKWFEYTTYTVEMFDAADEVQTKYINRPGRGSMLVCAGSVQCAPILTFPAV